MHLKFPYFSWKSPKIHYFSSLPHSRKKKEYPPTCTGCPEGKFFFWWWKVYGKIVEGIRILKQNIHPWNIDLEWRMSSIVTIFKLLHLCERRRGRGCRESPPSRHASQKLGGEGLVGQPGGELLWNNVITVRITDIVYRNQWSTIDILIMSPVWRRGVSGSSRCAALPDLYILYGLLNTMSEIRITYAFHLNVSEIILHWCTDLSEI